MPADHELPEAVRRAHDAAEANGEPGYLDPATGYFVFTRASLLANGRCCRNGCRHCPFGVRESTADDDFFS